MKTWFESLAPREQMMVLAGGLFGAGVLVYLFWLEPLHRRVDTARLEAQAQMALRTVVERAASARESSAGDGVAPTDQRSLLALVDATSRESGIGKAVRRIQPVGNDSVQVHLEDVPLDPALAWTADLDQRPGLSIAEFSARKSGPGVAQVSFRLQRQ